MISTNPFSEKPSSLETPGNVQQVSGAYKRWVATQSPIACCEGHLRRVVSDIDSPVVKDIVEVVFKDLLRLLDCLGLIENHLRQVDAADETFALFHLIHDEARGLVKFIRNDALNSSALSEELADTLDGITFVINHDLHRVFETDSSNSRSDKTTHIILSRMHRAHDVLTNCLQQSTISLATLFDRSLSGSKLFDNSDMRYRQSLQLCQDLLTLRQVVENVDEQADSQTLGILTSGISRFRNESMECLMYADWPQFESFCERIAVSLEDLPVLVPILHQFQCYLETLLGQVRMRAVFAENSPAASDSSSFDNFANATQGFAAQDEAHDWAATPVAV
ncbi:MAG TPA: hypothetical protein VJU86_01465 [Pyrinomonadaceae bacterium]|nr:hypothetical protein [Pyrinomonadaceae bacterium]